MNDCPSAIVIGGGFGGIAAALRLRARGWRVVLFDRAPMLGGRAQVFEREGFRHDAGPTVITAPFLIDELFALFGKRREDFVEFIPLSPWYRFRFADGDVFDYGGSVEDTLAEIQRIEPSDVAGYMNLLEHSRRMFDTAFTALSDQPFHELPTMLRQGAALAQLRAYKTVWGMVSHYLTNPKLRQAFSIQPLLLGGDPFETTSIYSLIHYLERQWGVLFAKGGAGAIIAALAKLMADQGVDIRLNSTVERVLIENGAARGVRLSSGEIIASDIVVSNADPMYLYRKMIDESAQPLSVRLKKHAKLSMGLFVLYFGTRRQYKDVAHHTIWLGARYRELLADIFQRRILPEDFSLYVHRPTATDESFAPPGCDSFYVLCPVPNLLGKIDWAVEGPRLQARIVKALGATLLPGLGEVMTADFFMTPEDFASRYLSFAGTGFSIAPLFSQSAWFRFHNRAEGVANLYLVGAGTHPGAGIPGVLCSAKVLDRLIPPAAAFVR
ncbi:phytoene desaturase [Methylocella silvestris BL2]|uniref:Phytoene dehydrogenase n=1 Tax=Methylocella silvestris (strain DSM 15510 / CIP 108128 / LMG 27833 / NCIMB 13906 / BL2) TaxID=395965 RepID=B8EPW5_METSB|nr:phytoene desaturase family protein [Methylocella silvestris]ACK50969.1 phytoene desaturase [Methylocella silvestris BL2]